MKQRTARPQTVKRLAMLATEYVVVKQGMYGEWKSMHIRKGGRSVQEHI
jgi:hypothetical protein